MPLQPGTTLGPYQGQLYRATDTRRERTVGVTALLAATVMAGACVTSVEYGRNEPISMGPWTFRVGTPIVQVMREGGNPFTRVRVPLTLDSSDGDRAVPFDDFLNGTTASTPFANPHFRLVDETGEEFDGYIVGVSQSRWSRAVRIDPDPRHGGGCE